MIKARKQDIEKLRDLSNGISRGLETLMLDKYAIMKRTNMSSADVFTANYYPDDNYCKITKEIGNELVPMFSAIRALAKLLNNDSPM